MIETSHVRERAQQLYADIKKRSKPTYRKSGKRMGRLLWPGMSVPYTSAQFATWLLETVGCTAFLCPFCNAPLDVLSMTLDHDIALKAGGSNEFNNLIPVCSDCNGLKHKLSGEQYRALRRALRELGPVIESNVLSRLRAGALGHKMLWQSSANKKQAAQEEEF